MASVRAGHRRGARPAGAAGATRSSSGGVASLAAKPSAARGAAASGVAAAAGTLTLTSKVRNLHRPHRMVVPEGGQAGRGGRAGAEIWGKARSPDPYISRGPPDAVNSGPTPRGGPYSPRLFTLRNHSTRHRSDSGGWTGGASAARIGKGGRNLRRQGRLGSRTGPGTSTSPQISAPARPPRPACSPSGITPHTAHGRAAFGPAFAPGGRAGAVSPGLSARLSPALPNVEPSPAPVGAPQRPAPSAGGAAG